MININQINRILVTRTDRIGDVVLSTPVLEALRGHFPNAWIAMMVGPHTRELVEGNPYLDEVLVYDKSGRERSWLGTWRFAKELRQKKFDVALHLHPANRVHWVSFLARIPVRVGYRYKNYKLLTHTIPHRKQEGTKHEAEYNFDLVNVLGVETPGEIRPYVPLEEAAHEKLRCLKKEIGLVSDSFIVLNPGASCPSKMWPASRFAKLGDELQLKYHLPVVLIGSEKEIALARQIVEWMKAKPMDLTGRLDLSETAWLLKEAKLLVSNDSGPVHIARAVGTPVISLFGRKQPGLSPKRWGPLGANSAVIHKDVGCELCWAHECPYSFLCLDAIGLEEVLTSIEKFEANFNR